MSERGPAALTFRVDGAYADINEHYQERGWTDGLPIVPPTEDQVQKILRWTDRDPRDVVGILPPRQGEATVERIAINAVMAGCRPDAMPVLITAIEAMADRAFNLDSVQPPRTRWRRSSSSTARSPARSASTPGTMPSARDSGPTSPSGGRCG